MRRLMNIALLGPDRAEFEAWGSEPSATNEWLGVAADARLKEDQNDCLPMLAFFEPYFFENGSVTVGPVRISHIAFDCYRVHEDTSNTDVFLNEDRRVQPAYPVHADYNTSTLSRFDLEVLGGASGFTPNEPCTGLVLCFNGRFMLIDSIPFLDQHLYARGISKNQITACFLTHVHDDHCSLFPLMLAPNPIEIITSKEIFNMAMEKPTCGLDWDEAVIREHLRFIEVTPGHQLNYYGLLIDPTPRFTVSPRLAPHSPAGIGVWIERSVSLVITIPRQTLLASVNRVLFQMVPESESKAFCTALLTCSLPTGALEHCTVIHQT